MSDSARLRAVLDTNIYLSGLLSRSSTSPASELLDRWEAGEWQLLTATDLFDELVEKLSARRVRRERILRLLILLHLLAEWVEIPHVPSILRDPDDDRILACAVQGKADYLVTHDKDFDPLGGEYKGVQIVTTLPFLWAVRGDQPPT